MMSPRKAGASPRGRRSRNDAMCFLALLSSSSTSSPIRSAALRMVISNTAAFNLARPSRSCLPGSSPASGSKDRRNMLRTLISRDRPSQIRQRYRTHTVIHQAQTCLPDSLACTRSSNGRSRSHISPAHLDIRSRTDTLGATLKRRLRVFLRLLPSNIRHAKGGNSFVARTLVRS